MLAEARDYRGGDIMADVVIRGLLLNGMLLQVAIDDAWAESQRHHFDETVGWEVTNMARSLVYHLSSLLEEASGQIVRHGEEMPYEL